MPVMRKPTNLLNTLLKDSPKLKAIADFALPSDPADAAMEMVGPLGVGMAAAKKGGQTMIDKMVKMFGTTKDLDDAAFILPDGRGIAQTSGSKQGGSKAWVGDAMFHEDMTKKAGYDLDDFVEKSGSVRQGMETDIELNYEMPVGRLTRQQQQAMQKQFARHKDIVMDSDGAILEVSSNSGRINTPPTTIGYEEVTEPGVGPLLKALRSLGVIAE